MSVIKNLKNDKKYQINIVEIVEKLLLPDQKTKYVELFLNLLIKEFNHISVKNSFKSMEESDLIKLIISNMILKMPCSSGDLIKDKLETLNDYIFYNEKKLTEKNDITKFKSFEELEDENDKAEIRYNKNKLKNEIINIYEDNEWLIIRPLTHFSSLKYGSNTQWCTSSKDNPHVFYDYAYKKILIYCINKMTNEKFAFEKSIKDIIRELDSSDTNFWNSNDKKTDSLFLNIPEYIKLIIKEHTNENNLTNYDMSSKLVKNLYPNVIKKEYTDFVLDDADDNDEEPPNEPVDRRPEGEEAAEPDPGPGLAVLTPNEENVNEFDDFLHKFLFEDKEIYPPF